jgi:hypothetical protein
LVAAASAQTLGSLPQPLDTAVAGASWEAGRLAAVVTHLSAASGDTPGRVWVERAAAAAVGTVAGPRLMLSDGLTELYEQRGLLGLVVVAYTGLGATSPPPPQFLSV